MSEINSNKEVTLQDCIRQFTSKHQTEQAIERYVNYRLSMALEDFYKASR